MDAFDSLKLLLFFVVTGLLPGLALAFYITRERADFNIIDRLWLAAILSPFVLVLASMVEEAFGVPQSPAVLTLNLILIASITILIMVRYSRPTRIEWNFSTGRSRLLVYPLFGSLVFFRVGPTAKILTPLLHDPIAHSVWLKFLNVNHHVTSDQWYPQGLVYYLNYYATFLDYSYPKLVLVVTNFLLALIPVSMFYLGLLLFRSNKRGLGLLMPISMLLLASLTLVPNDFYFIAGKNSRIFAFIGIPMVLYMSYWARSKIQYLACALLILSIFLVHFPTGFFGAAVFAVISIFRIVTRCGWRLTVDWHLLGNLLLSVAVSLFLALVYLVRITIPAFSSNPDELGNPVRVDFAYSQIPVIMSDAVHASYDAARIYFSGNTLSPLLIPVSLVAVIAFIIVKDELTTREVISRLILTYTGLFILGAVLPAFGGSAIVSFYNADLVFFYFFVFVTIISWLVLKVFDLITKNLLPDRYPYLEFALSVVIAGIFIIGNIDKYNLFLASQRALETTQASDIQAFDFINNHTASNKKILIQMNKAGEIVMGSDSGVWISSFTDREVEVDFNNFSKARAPEIYDLYLQLALDSNDLKTLEELHCDYDIGYVFFGSKKVFPYSMSAETLESSPYLQKIFDNEAKLYRIEDISCKTY